MGVGGIDQECLWERVGLIKSACGSGQNCSSVSVGAGEIGQNSLGSGWERD